MHLEKGGSGQVNLHIHLANDKFIYNGTTFLNNTGKAIPRVINDSDTVINGINKAVDFAKKAGWKFP